MADLNEKLNGILKKGDSLYSPRFCTIWLDEVFDSVEELRAAGFNEPTYFNNKRWEIRGKSIDMYHMLFAAAPKMPIFTVEITETLAKTFRVMAPSAEEAESNVQMGYFSDGGRDDEGNAFLLTADDFCDVTFKALTNEKQQ